MDFCASALFATLLLVYAVRQKTRRFR